MRPDMYSWGILVSFKVLQKLYSSTSEQMIYWLLGSEWFIIIDIIVVFKRKCPTDIQFFIVLLQLQRTQLY